MRSNRIFTARSAPPDGGTSSRWEDADQDGGADVFAVAAQVDLRGARAVRAAPEVDLVVTQPAATSSTSSMEAAVVYWVRSATAESRWRQGGLRSPKGPARIRWVPESSRRDRNRGVGPAGAALIDEDDVAAGAQFAVAAKTRLVRWPRPGPPCEHDDGSGARA